MIQIKSYLLNLTSTSCKSPSTASSNSILNNKKKIFKKLLEFNFFLKIKSPNKILLNLIKIPVGHNQNAECIFVLVL